MKCSSGSVSLWSHRWSAMFRSGRFSAPAWIRRSIVAMMCRAATEPVRTYTVTFPKKYSVGETTSTPPAVPARLAERLGCRTDKSWSSRMSPACCPASPGTWTRTPTADPAIITAYLVCREARKQATVLLSGVGGDESFAGYRKHAARRRPIKASPRVCVGEAGLPWTAESARHEHERRCTPCKETAVARR